MKEAQFNFCKSFRYIFEQGIIAQIFTKNIFYVRSPISPWLGPQQRLLDWNCFVFLIILYLFLAEYTPPSIIFFLLLWKIRDISFQFFSLYFGVYNINSGLATSQFQLCQYIYFYQYNWIVLTAAATWKSLHIFWAQTLMTPAMRQFKRCNLSSSGQPCLMFSDEGSQSDGANYSLGNQRSSPQFPRYTLRAPARRRSASWRKMLSNWKGKVGW